MIRLVSALAACVLLFLAAPDVRAVEPSEMLEDPALEARAREISKNLRCLVCQNQSIDDSNAELAKDLRVIVRQRLLAGDSNDDVFQFVVDRYGEYVLLTPPLRGSTYALWFGPIALLIVAGGTLLVLAARRRHANAPAPSLSSEEQARLSQLLGDKHDTH